MDKQAIVDALVKYAGGRMICVYTGREVPSECAVDLYGRIPIRGRWLHWDGKVADSEPPIYIPVCVGDTPEEDINEYVDTVARLSVNMCVSIIEGEGTTESIPGTWNTMYADLDVSDEDILVVLMEPSYKDIVMDGKE